MPPAPLSRVKLDTTQAVEATPVQPQTRSWNGWRVAQGIGGALLIAAAIWTAPITAPISLLITIVLVCTGIIATTDAIFTKKVQPCTQFSSPPVPQKLKNTLKFRRSLDEVEVPTETQRPPLSKELQTMDISFKGTVRAARKNEFPSYLLFEDRANELRTQFLKDTGREFLIQYNRVSYGKNGTEKGENRYEILREKLSQDGLSEDMIDQVINSCIQTGAIDATHLWMREHCEIPTPKVSAVDRETRKRRDELKKQEAGQAIKDPTQPIIIKVLSPDKVMVRAVNPLRMQLRDNGSFLRDAEYTYEYTLRSNHFNKVKIEEIELYDPETGEELQKAEAATS